MNKVEDNAGKLIAWEKLLKMLIKEFRQKNYNGICRMLRHKAYFYDINLYEYRYLDKELYEDVVMVRKLSKEFGGYLFSIKDFESRYDYIQGKIKSLKDLAPGGIRG